MPDRRRPGLWKTLVAAAQTAFDRVADGLEAAAEGLRSFGGDRAPAPPNDPRLAGVDPGIAAYVAAQDPEWFSFDLSGDAAEPEWIRPEGTPPQWPMSDPVDWAAAAAEHRQAQAAGRPSSTSSEPSGSRPRPARGMPTAAELPGGRPVPPSRISFRRPSRDAGDRHASGVDAGVDAGSPVAARPKSKSAGDGDPKGSQTPAPGTADVAPSAGTEDRGSRPPPQAPHGRPDDRAPRGAGEDGQPPRLDHIPPGAPSPEPWLGSSPSSRSQSIAVTSRPVGESPFAPTATATPAPAAARQRPHDPTWPAPPRVSPAPAPPSRERTEPVTRSRPASPAATAPAVRLSRGDRSVRAAWPELPPSTWSAAPADSAGMLAWEGAAPADVLVDEQRST